MRSIRYLIVVMLLSFLGCAGKTEPAPQELSTAASSANAGPLRLLVYDDAELATILEREWRARSEHQIEVAQDSSDNLSQQLADGLDKLTTDVVIFPSRFLGELVERRLIRQVPTQLVEEPAYRQLDIFHLIRRQEIAWNERIHAVPLGSPPLVLLTRPDLVAQPPSTWGELHQQVQLLRQQLPAGTSPLLQPLAEGWASRLLLVRAAAYLHDPSRVSTMFDYRTMEPRIHTPPFVRALEELVADYRADQANQTPSSVLRAFLDGKAAIAITWPSALASADDAVEVSFPVAIDDIPGARERYDYRSEAWKNVSATSSPRRVTVTGLAGRLGAISRAAQNVQQATTFLGWASGPDQSRVLAPRSTATTLFRDSHQEDPQAWIHSSLPANLAQSYAELVATALSRPETMLWLRIPHQQRYVATLETAVLAAIRGELTAEAALQQVAQQWKSLRDELGSEQQIRAYRRSLGVDTTP